MNKNIYMIGIGGSSMSGIAMILKNYGYNVSGSDTSQGKMVERLKDNGIKVNPSQVKENITKEIDLVVYTAAINDDNEELKEAKRLGIKTVVRGDFLGELTLNFKDVIGISGTHGKTTTSSMVSSVFVKANMDPTIQIGANLGLIGGNYRIGESDYFIIEACEYKDSYQSFKQKSAIVTNIDNDHLDYFKNIDNIVKSFREYVSHLPSDGLLVLNMDDERCFDLRNYTKARVVTTSTKNNKADYFATNIEYDEMGCASYDVYKSEEFLATVKLSVKGELNVYNSLECFALSYEYKVPKESILKGLKAFTGSNRRMEYKGEFHGAKVYDDYAHHPTEIMATTDAILKENFNESYALFEAHTFSRVYNHLDKFIDALSKYDHVIVTPIFPARETNIYNVKEEDIVSKLMEKGKDAVFIKNYEDIKTYLIDKVKENDLIITLGAGKITSLAEFLTKEKTED